VHSLPTVQSAGAGQVLPALQLLLPEHTTSHWHELAHVIAPSQLLLPAHVTAHAPAPQVAPPLQLCGPLQASTHALACEQSTPALHDFEPAQSTLQGRPGGHTTCAAHAEVPSQRITQVSPTQDVHWLGQACASGWPGFASGWPGFASGRTLASAAAASMAQVPA
jgi:hypothetical protein